jgi:cell division protein FtsB
MWNCAKTRMMPSERNLSRRTDCMAHRKGLVTARVGAALAVGLLLGVLTAGRVLVLNQMAAMRAEIAVLQDEKGFLETKSATLQESWNHETSSAVICDRAARELGLVRPAEPGPVLVKLPVDRDKPRWTWPSWLEGIAGGDQVQAQDLAAGPSGGQMVHLRPTAAANVQVTLGREGGR